MRDDHTRERKGPNRLQGLKVVAGGMTTIKGERGAIKKRMAQIKKEDGAVAGNKSVNDGSGGQWSGQRMTEQGKMQQPIIDGSGNDEQ